jgi:hypothetical protein
MPPASSAGSEPILAALCDALIALGRQVELFRVPAGSPTAAADPLQGFTEVGRPDRLAAALVYEDEYLLWIGRTVPEQDPNRSIEVVRASRSNDLEHAATTAWR